MTSQFFFCVFQIIVGCRGVKNDLFVVLHRMYCTYVAMPKTEGNERGVKIIPTFLRRHAKYKVSQRKIHIFFKRHFNDDDYCLSK